MARQGAKQGTPGAGQTSLTTGSVRVSIGGQNLSLRSDKDPERVREIAAYLDDKVTALQDNAPAVSLDKLVMLAAMTITEELFESREASERLRTDVEQRVARALDAVAEAEAELETS